MVKIILGLVLALVFLVSGSPSLAETSSFVNLVNPIRGDDFWEDPLQAPIEAVSGQAVLAKKYNIPVTWLLRYDALESDQIVSFLKQSSLNQEFGLFLEVTPSWTKPAGVNYVESESWHLAGSVFLTGYPVPDRQRLIDQAFLKFKERFGSYPKSVGAWWIDAGSLEYMQKKYTVTVAMIVADQFNTDNYQVWGQYWGSPYYPTKKNTLFPAQSQETKIPVVITQWAARDPINGYGSGVQESTYSLQVNDYLDYHDLGQDYFAKLIDIFTVQDLNQINQVVVGLENSYSWNRYKNGYEEQLQVLSQKRAQGRLKLTTLAEFGQYYLATFPNLSPTQVIVADDPLGSDQKAVWFMNPFHRAGWFFDKLGARFRDIRIYNEGQEEPCYQTACQEMKITSYVTRVLDEISFGQSLLLDQGKISDFLVVKENQDVKLSYKNEAGGERIINFMPRDIAIDGTVRTIDGTIMFAQSESVRVNQAQVDIKAGSYFWPQMAAVLINLIKFLGFLVLVILIPGLVLVRLANYQLDQVMVFVAVCLGMTLLTLLSFVLGYLNVDYLIYLYLLTANLWFVFKGYPKELVSQLLNLLKKLAHPLTILVIVGTFFQSLALIRSGWVYDFGVGFWGPLGHDLVWHQALINQLIVGVPPQNPIFSGQALLNYHYFYDLLVAITYKLTAAPVGDLIYRFYPVLFSIMLGVGTYLLSKRLFNSRLTSLLAVYFVYFAGSFGWVVDWIKFSKLSGESAFWANQAVSFNLNPPFAISLVILIGVILWLQNILKQTNLIGGLIMVILAGTLIEFKSYAGLLVLAALFLIAFQQLIIQKSLYLIKVTIPSLVTSAAVFLPQNSGSQNLIIFEPFWFIHSMIDYSDRIGWLKLSQARQAYLERGEVFKYLLAEGLGLMMFIVGNLGMRFVGLIQLIKWLFKLAYLDRSFIAYLTIISLALPIFFIQKGNSWNLIQFMYYGLYLVAVLSGYIVSRFTQSLPKALSLIILLLFLILVPVNSIDTFKNGFSAHPPARLSHAELEALNFLTEQEDGVVLTYPFDKNQRAKFRDPFKLLVYETTSYVSAYSGKSVYIEDEIQHEIFLNDFKKRLVASNDLFNRRNYSWSRQFLKDNQIKYIYLPKLYRVELDTSQLILLEIFENDEVSIYQVN